MYMCLYMYVCIYVYECWCQYWMLNKPIPCLQMARAELKLTMSMYHYQYVH